MSQVINFKGLKAKLCLFLKVKKTIIQFFKNKGLFSFKSVIAHNNKYLNFISKILTYTKQSNIKHSKHCFHFLTQKQKQRGINWLN